MLFLLGVGRKEKPIGQVERGCSKCAGQPFPWLWNRRAGLPSFSFPVIPFGASSGTRCNLCGMRYLDYRRIEVASLWSGPGCEGLTPLTRYRTPPPSTLTACGVVSPASSCRNTYCRIPPLA